MTRRILIELALFLIPFAVFLFYRIASRELRVRDRWPLTTLVVVGGVLAVGTFVLEPLLSPSDKGKCYIAARYEKGVTTPAKLVDCKSLQPNKDGTAATPAPASTAEPAPVAPRDETPSLPKGIPTQQNEKLVPPGIPAPATGAQPAAPPPPQPLLPPPSGGPH